MGKINGTSGNDHIFSTKNADTIYGYGGDDELHGGLGADVLYGGDGTDTLYGEDGNDTLSGDAGNDVLWGGAGTDRLNGGDGDDVLHGGDGNENGRSGGLMGGAGNDTIYGDSGDDVVVGGAGADVLWGGTGADEFRYYGWPDSTSAALSGVGVDQIMDFNPGEGDFINLHQAIAGVTYAADGTLAPHTYTVTFDGTWTHLNADSSGDGVADLSISMLGNFTASDGYNPPDYILF
jgi:Ca2+-binding RTX toxin-like protein